MTGLAIRIDQVNEERILPGFGAVAVGANTGVVRGGAVICVAGQAGGVGAVINL